ncbi:WxcM-like domain-containing protein [Emticicia sp. CRIBPO]|uniref:sugar 3,4-ketoisomerase n=1 Tax=Emticicia sp. CRIBPO TaxID=2683258 RepID=UPI00141349AE|nr:FdtA/QdtA family cupin domain-containing protein [Emticicia sp. CRIBPO]NBA86456.1 WxcM-like domain-containing protein [Emticicia sp. CRIBPO]
MATLLQLDSFKSESGDLTVLEKIFPTAIKRVFYICDVPSGSVRGGHRHHKTWQALVCLKGECRVFVDNGSSEEFYQLNSSNQCLILEPKDWHLMDNFSEGSILLVIANETYDKADYIDTPYPKAKNENSFSRFKARQHAFIS